ncbi:unnamed protein product [Gadus morhua 'NCC']
MRFVRVSVCRAASFRTTDSSAAQRWRTIHSRRHIPPSRDASSSLLVVVVLGKAAPWTTAPSFAGSIQPLHLQLAPSHPTALVGGWWCLIPAFRLLAEPLETQTLHSTLQHGRDGPGLTSLPEVDPFQ